jgi:hypothetical protein
MSSVFARSGEAPLTGRFSLPTASAWAGGGLLVLSWLTTEHFLPWVSWHGEAVAFFAVVVVAWAGLGARLKPFGGTEFRVPMLALPFALLAVLTLTQFAFGLVNFAGDVVVAWLYLALCIICLIAGFNLRVAAASEGETPWSAASVVATAFIGGSIASVLVAFAQLFDLFENTAWVARMYDLRRPGANLGQPNHLATLLVMGAGSVGFLHASRKLNSWTSALLLLVLGAGLAASESRTGLLSLFVLVIWWQLKRPVIAPQVSRWAAPAAGLVMLAMFAGWPAFLDALQLLQSGAVGRFAQRDLRLAIWSQLLEAVWLKPWWGWGIGGIVAADNAVAHAHALQSPLIYSHNIVLDWALWMGVPVAIALTIAWGAWFWRRAVQAERPMAWYCLAVFLPLAVHSLLEFPYTYAYFLAPVLFLLGMLERSAGGTTRVRVGAAAAGGLLLVFTGALLWSAVEYLRIEEDFRIVRFEQLRVGHTPVEYHRPEVVLFTQLGTLLTGSRIELRPSMPPEDMEQLKALALRYPWTATQYRYAVALALNGNPQEANRQFRVIRAQRGEIVYRRLKNEFEELAQSRYPQLSEISLP